jgi:RNA polymerase sigma factor (sigma-70 family)
MHSLWKEEATMNADQGSNPGELTDSDLDQLLAVANEELLAHIKAVADPTSALAAIMARIAPAAPVSSTTNTTSTAGGSDTRLAPAALAPGTSLAAILRSKQEIHEGELAELAALYQKLAPDLIRYLRRMLQHSSGLAEDIAQEAFLILVRKWPDVRNHPQPEAWIYTVGRHLALTTLKERSREFLQEEPLDQVGTGGDDPSDRYNDTARVLEAIGKLPPRQREAVMLFYFQEYAQDEIAVIMQIRRAAVKALLFQARRRLAELLGSDMR